ncbi:hypothetical protein Taro_007768 [Colocasia esculenta]|uniref:Uncharacterized protein n=1 Tax=Colocasia esculenta TaxID=4460 RepID=A0A843TWE0_COLES|nr:hypothetical protein [Colocasia esculenta]
MNCAELDPYIEEFDSVILRRNPRLTDVQVEKEREKSFPTWLRSRVEQGFITNSRVQEIRDMVYGGRSRRVSTSVGRGSASLFTTGTASLSTPVVPATGTTSPSTPVVPATGTASPTTPVAPPFPSSSPPEVESQHPAADEEGPQLPAWQPCWISGGKIDPGSASRYITTLVHTHIPGPVDAWREFSVPVWDLLFDMFTRYTFTRPEDLPRARAVWESTAQTNLRKSMYEARDKAMKTTGNRDPMAWLDYDPVWLRRDYWESLCERWATEPWQERSQEAKRNRSTHPEKNVHTSGSVSYATHSQKLHQELERAPTFRELFDRTHKRKGTDDYVSESARMIAETYDRTMADRYAEGTPQPDLDPEAWVDVAGGPRKGRVYGFGDSWILLQCCPHMRVRSLLRHTRVHLLRRPTVV